MASSSYYSYYSYSSPSSSPSSSSNSPNYSTPSLTSCSTPSSSISDSDSQSESRSQRRRNKMRRKIYKNSNLREINGRFAVMNLDRNVLKTNVNGLYQFMQANIPLKDTIWMKNHTKESVNKLVDYEDEIDPDEICVIPIKEEPVVKLVDYDDNDEDVVVLYDTDRLVEKIKQHCRKAEEMCRTDGSNSPLKKKTKLVDEGVSFLNDAFCLSSNGTTDQIHIKEEESFIDLVDDSNPSAENIVTQLVVKQEPSINTESSLSTGPFFNSEPTISKNTSVKTEPVVSTGVSINSEPAFGISRAQESTTTNKVIKEEPVFDLEPAYCSGTSTTNSTGTDQSIANQIVIKQEPLVVDSEPAIGSVPIVNRTVAQPRVKQEPLIELEPAVNAEPVIKPTRLIEPMESSTSSISVKQEPLIVIKDDPVNIKIEPASSVPQVGPLKEEEDDPELDKKSEDDLCSILLDNTLEILNIFKTEYDMSVPYLEFLNLAKLLQIDDINYLTFPSCRIWEKNLKCFALTMINRRQGTSQFRPSNANNIPLRRCVAFLKSLY